ncbi:hypothetical protein SAMN05192583_0503 [Sphingomonas gellani]|uniref:WalW protein n=1 Tax=Sphingomonas gellani TaxID=1166340 RepID=A0A1H7Z1T1_9SPHN|nr:WalW protein [Sphingomonas gellani]SEM52286.1 hypothetical protein SAMN05192583_0503 [Sphingomonas gellani]
MTQARASLPYRPPAPDPDELVCWPADFGTRFTLFCDVEEEFDWRASLSRDGWSTTAMSAFPDAHRRFAGLDMPLACMVDYAVAADPTAADYLASVRDDPRCAIGAQLHPWVTPPFEEAVTPFNSYAGNLPPSLEAAKIATLTDTIATRFGRPPVAYRAGRYGIGPDTLSVLAALGYRLDTSVRAAYDYRADGGPDFRAIGSSAYRRDRVIELPFTTVHTGMLRGRGASLYRRAAGFPHGPGVLVRLGLVQRVSLTPEDMPLRAALEAVTVAVGEGTRLLTFSFHSPSLAPGHTPYVRDAADLAAFWRWWDAMAERLVRLGVRSASLNEILNAAG